MEPTGTLTIPLVYGLGLEQDLILGNRDRQGGGQGGDQGTKQADNQRIAVERTDSPGEPIWMNADGVRQIQQVPNQRGYAAGHRDGNWYNDTTIAATHFQQAQGLEPTGTLTPNLLATLGMSRWERGGFLGGMTAGANTPGNPNPQTTGSFSGSGGSASGGADGDSAKSDAPAGQGSGDARAASGSR